MLSTLLWVETDWSQLWPGMIATLVGVALPFVIDRIIHILKNRKRKQSLIQDFKLELSKNSVELEKWDSTKVLPSTSTKVLKTIIYDIAISTGEMSLINAETRKAIAEVYELSVSFNNCVQEQTRFYFDKNRLNHDIKQITEELKKQIIIRAKCIDWGINAKEESINKDE